MRKELPDIGGSMVVRQALVLALMYLSIVGMLILVSGISERNFNE